MTPSEETPATGQPNPAEDRMTILERRLAEIQAKQQANPNAPDPAGMPPSAPAPAPVAETVAPATPTASAPAAEEHVAPTPGSPEEAAARETAQHVSPAVEASQPELLSAPQARALEHYGNQSQSQADAAPAAEAAGPAAAAENATPEAAAPAAAEDALAEATTPEAAPAAAAPAPPATEAAEDAPAAGSGSAPAAPAAEVATNPTEAEAATLTAAAPSAEVPTESAATESAATEAEEDYVPETPAPDFASLDLEQQASYLLGLLRRPDAGRNRKQILDLNRQYEAAVGAARAATRQRFADDANAPAELAFQAPAAQAELNKAMQEFRESRARDARAEDEQRTKNLALKQGLITRLRELVEAAETKDSSAKLKALQQEWKAIGPVPQTDSQELWNTYHGLLDIYYSNQSRFHELKDLDRRRNLEAKEALIQRAEALSQQSSINKALEELKKLHEDWKHIGPVPNEQREPLWQRFLAASEVIHNRRKEFVDARSVQEQVNLKIKQDLLARVLPFATFETDRVNLWRSKTDELQEIKAEWEAAGLVPRAQADALNKQYWTAYKAFFNRKNQFFKSLDDEKNANLQRKMALIEQAEEALNSEDWESARNTVIRVQKEWKDIGRVPEKQADKIWKRFRAACDSFFDRPKQQAQQRQQQADQASVAQVEHLGKVGEAVAALSADNPGTLEGFRALAAEWTNFDAEGGQTSDRGEEQFLTLMGKYLDQVPDLSYADRNELLFQLEISRLKARPQAQQQLTRKEMGLRREIQELENDLATLQTNLDFFARSKNADQLRQEYEGRMGEARQRIETLKKQLKAVRS